MQLWYLLIGIAYSISRFTSSLTELFKTTLRVDKTSFHRDTSKEGQIRYLFTSRLPAWNQGWQRVINWLHQLCWLTVAGHATQFESDRAFTSFCATIRLHHNIKIQALVDGTDSRQTEHLRLVWLCVFACAAKVIEEVDPSWGTWNCAIIRVVVLITKRAPLCDVCMSQYLLIKGQLCNRDKWCSF